MKRIGMVLSVCMLGACAAAVPQDGGQVLQGAWQIREAEGQAVRPDVVLVFDGREQAFSVSTDCNRLFGRYTVSAGQTVQVGGIASTLMACPHATAEQQLARLLPQVQRYRMEGKWIELADPSGKTLLRGERVKGH